MFDLNLTFVHDDMTTAVRGELEESGTSNSSLVNAEACSSSNVGDDESVSIAGDGDNFQCFNFDILKVEDASTLLHRNSNDEVQTRSEFVTQTLFPINPGQQVNSLLLFPDNKESEEMRSVHHVQQNMPTVQQNQVGKKSRRGPRSRSSQYRGVTFYRRTGRWESHIWDCGKQVYLGGFDTAHDAARAYDRAAIKFRGVDADINFNISDYEEDMNQQIKNLSKQDFVHMLRRHSSGFPRGGPKFRGVTMNNCSLWEAQMGQFLGKKAAMKSNTYCNWEAAAAASHCGNGQNLDLNLGISTPSCHGNDSSRNSNFEHMQMNHGLPKFRRLQAGLDPPARTLEGLPVISEHSQSLMGINPGPSDNWGHGQSQSSEQHHQDSKLRRPAPNTVNCSHQKAWYHN